MKLIPGLVLNEVCGQSFVVPMGEQNIDFSKVISLNDSSLIMWKRMEQGDFTIDDLVTVMLDEYDIDEATARRDIEGVIAQFRQEGVITE